MSRRDPVIAQLPAVLREIAETCGLGAALSLLQAYGGQRIYVPARCPDGHRLVRLLGREAADALAAAFGPGPLDLPRHARAGYAARVAETHRLTAAGQSANQIARSQDVTRRTVFNRRRVRPAALPLFELRKHRSG